MKRLLILAVAAVSAVSAEATAVVGDVTFAQGATDRRVTVTYTIDEPAIVTVDVQTNRGDGVFASIGAANVRGFVGEVNKLVLPREEPYTLTWRPDLTWTEGGRIDGENAKVVVTAWATNAPPDYMVVSLTDPDVVRYYVSAEALPYDATNEVYKTDYLVMRRIHAAGKPFRMGSTTLENEVGRYSGYSGVSSYDQGEVKIVTMSDDYYIGIFEFTIGQWMRCVEKTKASGGAWSNAARGVPGAKYDVIRGSVADGIDYPATGNAVKKDSPIDELRNKLGIELDLPTEAQWEYACRAGTSGAVYGPVHSEAFIAANAWYRDHPGAWDGTYVGHFPPNPWGLYDMLGGQWEWCLDKNDSGLRVGRGGGFNIWWQRITSSVRLPKDPNSSDNTWGFRLTAPCVAPYKTK